MNQQDSSKNSSKDSSEDSSDSSEVSSEFIPHYILSSNWRRIFNYTVSGNFSLHGLCRGRSKRKLKIKEKKRKKKKFSGEVSGSGEDFDSSFDDELKYHLMYKWSNSEMVTKEGLDYKVHSQVLVKDQCEKHAKDLGMSNKAYVQLTTELFEKIENNLNMALISSTGPCFGFIGIRKLLINEFLSKLASLEIFPTIHVYRIPNITPSAEFPKGNYQFLRQVKVFLNLELCFIPPPYLKDDAVKGNYKPGEPVFLM